MWLNDSVLADGAVTPETVDEPFRLQVNAAELLANVENWLAVGEGRAKAGSTIRTTQPGEYQVMPIPAREFHSPEVSGRADGRLFVISE